MLSLPRAYNGLFLFATLLALGFGGAQVFADPDTAWHLAAGQEILARGAVPMHDPWSFTAGDEIWYNLSWLYDIGLSLVFSLGGFSAIYALTLLGFAGVYVWMASSCLRRGAGFFTVCFILLLGVMVGFGGVLARPNLCSLALTLVFYEAMRRHGETGRLRPLLFLPPLMALWVNLHGGFLLAYVVMGVHFLDAWRMKNRPRATAICAAGAGCLAASLLNPWGLGVYYGAWRTLSWGLDSLLIVEWLPVGVGRDIPATMMLALFLLLGGSTDKRIPWTDRMLSGLLMLLALSSLRHGAVAILLSMPFLSLRATHLLAESRWAGGIAKREAVVMQDMQKPDMRALGAVFAVVALALLWFPFPRDMLLRHPVSFPPESFPSAEAAYVSARYPEARLLNDYNIGGYLVLLWRGSTKVFVDGRAISLYSKDLLTDYSDLIASGGFGGRAETIVRQYALDGVIITHDNPAAILWQWNPLWKLAFRGDVASVYMRPGLAPESYFPQKAR